MCAGEVPQRPGQHVLEDASRRAFEYALPGEWIYRQQSHDYGIDGEVEVFQGGRATGLLFKVQLKATSIDDEARALSVAIPIEKESYYLSLGRPVLVVLYHQPADRLYIKWFQSFDPHYGGRTEKSIVFRFTAEEEYRDDTPARLVTDLQVFRRLRDPRAVLPLSLGVEVREELVSSAREPQLLLRLRDLSQKLGDVVRFDRADPGGTRGTVIVHADRCVVSMRGLATTTIHYSPPEFVPQDIDQLARDSLVAIGLLLDRLGVSDAAARVLGLTLEGSSVVDNPEVVLHVVRSFARAHRVKQALDLADRLASSSREQATLSIELLQLPALMLRETLSSEENVEVVAALQRTLEHAVQSDDERASAIAHHNLGNKLRSLSRHREALGHYRKAAQLDPTYMQRAYFPAEMAGSLFELDEFELSAEMYGRSIELGENGRLGALRADALMYSGQYLRAQEQFHSYNSSDEKRVSEWRIKEWALGRIRSLVGDYQERDPDRAIRQTEHGERIGRAGKRVQDLQGIWEEALKVDGLCGPAWFDLAELAAENDDYQAAFENFTIAGVITRHAVQPWLWATILGAENVEDEFFEDVVTCAYLFNRGAFTDELVSKTADYPDRTVVDRMTSKVDSIVSRVNSSRDEVVIRILEDGASYRSLHIPLGHPPQDHPETEGSA